VIQFCPLFSQVILFTSIANYAALLCNYIALSSAIAIHYNLPFFVVVTFEYWQYLRLHDEQNTCI
jgi:hypothetical protein